MSNPELVLGWRVPVTITLKSPFVTKGLQAANTAIDTPLAREAKAEGQKGRPVLPGSLLRGTVRDALETICARLAGDLEIDGTARPLGKDIAALFGNPSPRAKATTVGTAAGVEANTPDRGLLDFPDLATDEPEPDIATRVELDSSDGTLTRVKIDKVRGSVEHGHLQVIELPWPIGMPVTFTGDVWLAAGAVEPNRARALLEKALRLIPALGAIKSSGFGEVAKCSVGEPVECKASPHRWQEDKAPLPNTAMHIAIALTLDRPILVSATRAAENIFRGSEVIPGGAIKGALARVIADSGWDDAGMQALLSEMTITHAFPLPRAQATADKPVPSAFVPPLSLVMAGQPSKPADILLQPGPPGLLTQGGKPQSLRFQVDWKGKKERREALAHAGLGINQPPRDVRTHTAVSREWGTSAYQEPDEPGGEGAGLLFSTSAVVPDGFLWVLRIAARAESEHLARLRGLLKAGLPGIGKTGAVATAEWITTIAPPSGAALQADKGVAESYAITLQTPALLNDIDGLRAGRSLADDYATYWQGLGYRLERFFARQRLIGGHLALRYPPHTDRWDNYLLSEPGSVFLVTPLPSTPAHPPAELAAFGLPLNQAFASATWRTCPFLRENGFGMVAFNVGKPGKRRKDLEPWVQNPVTEAA
ncbi:MAG: RAMP superfamily CRISPR-associated protein [Defluviicoccus sp.]